MNLSPSKFDFGFDIYGGSSLSCMLKSLRPNGTLFSIGNVVDSHLTSSILPFILRGVSLIGINAETSSDLTNSDFWVSSIDNLCKDDIFSTFQSVSLFNFYESICHLPTSTIVGNIQDPPSRFLISFDG